MRIGTEAPQSGFGRGPLTRPAKLSDSAGELPLLVTNQDGGAGVGRPRVSQQRSVVSFSRPPVQGGPVLAGALDCGGGAGRAGNAVIGWPARGMGLKLELRAGSAERCQRVDRRVTRLPR